MITPPPDPAVAWLAATAAPVGPSWAAWSKNRTWRHRRGQRTPYVAGAAREIRADLAERIRAAMRERVVPPGRRVWVAIHVEKPSARCDAANVVDLVLDAVQDATGVDDRWAAIYRVSWAVNHPDPAVHVWVGTDCAGVVPRVTRRPPARPRARVDLPPEPPPDPARRAPWLPAVG